MSTNDEPQPGAKLRFLLVHGVLAWGLPFFLLMLLWDYLELDAMPPTMKILELACISAFGGIVLGLWLWKDRANTG